MISVLTITYQRHHLLEEAMRSYLDQSLEGESEMVVINDSPQVRYVFSHQRTMLSQGGIGKRIRIINLPTRFSNIGRKLEYGYKECFGDFVYRLDDDDLLHPSALTQVQSWIDTNPGYEVYRASNFYQFEDNVYTKISEGINTGNVLSREYINRFAFPDKSADEDLDIVFSPGVKMYTAPDTKTMLYRWGMSTTHISTQLHLPNEDRLNFVPAPESGTIVLNPQFKNDYYGQINARQNSSL